MPEKIYPTVAEVREATAHAIKTIEQLTFHDSYVIEDYPIGSRNRGRCLLEAEFVKGKGSRTVRTTTDKYGRWCKPKKSVFHNNIIRVVTGPPVEREAAWLLIGDTFVSLQNASYDGKPIAKAPYWIKPRREAQTSVIITKEIFGGKEERKEYVHEADPPELCDAWDAWEEGRNQIIALVRTIDAMKVAT